MERARAWFSARVVEPLKAYVRAGAEPRLLARSAAVGFVLGLCPLLGVSTGLALVVLFIAPSGSLHAPCTLLANLLSIPVEVAMIVPFMRFGELLLGAPHLALAPVAIKDILFNHPGDALLGVGHALLGWAVAGPLIAAALTVVLTPAFRFLRRRFMARHSDSGLDMPWAELATPAMGSSDAELDTGPLLGPAATRMRSPPRGSEASSIDGEQLV